MSKKQTNMLPTLVSVDLVYGRMEFLIFPMVLLRLPSALFRYSPRDVRLLGQTSKVGLLFQSGYLALTGDSYAQGNGDWFIYLCYDCTVSFRIPHLFLDALGRDVLTFGRSSVRSVGGLVQEPVEDLRALRRLDLAIPDHDCSRLRHHGAFQAFLEETAAIHVLDEPRETGGSLFFGDLLLFPLRGKVWYLLLCNFSDPDYLLPAETINAAVVDSKLQRLPNRRFTPEQALADSRALAARIRDFSGRHGLAFIDTLPELRAAASQALIHGPRDWGNFNKVWYEAFPRTIVQDLPAVPHAPRGL